MSALDQRCQHEKARSSPVWFRLLTKRLPHHQHAEAYQDDGEGNPLWVRVCAHCTTTLSLAVAPRSSDAA